MTPHVVSYNARIQLAPISVIRAKDMSLLAELGLSMTDAGYKYAAPNGAPANVLRDLCVSAV